MRFTVISSLLVMLAVAAVAPAQTKISGTVQCGKPGEQHILEVGDQPHHWQVHLDQTYGNLRNADEGRRRHWLR
jgi:hypothetical protein